MIYFCADDYGISNASNSRIENCLKDGILNKISVLPNGEITDFKSRLEENSKALSLHLNLIEGRPLSDTKDVDLLITDEGFFKYSFAGLFLISLSPKRKRLKKQLYTEIKNQIKFWEKMMGENTPLFIDSHQHTHMIPLIFKTLIEVIKEEGVNASYLRIPAEPLKPYIFTPSLYLSYSPTGIIKQWILKILGFVNKKELKKVKISHAYFMGVMFSGNLTLKIIKKLLPSYIKLSEKTGKNIEIAFHPGYLENGEQLISGAKNSFRKFYYSPKRKAEFDTLINLKLK